MAEIYNSNNVPSAIPGGAVIFKKPDGSAMADGGVRVIEPGTPFKPKKEGVLVERSGALGGADGFSIAGAPAAGKPAEKQQKTSITIQVPRSDSPPVELGHYTDILSMGEEARWVVHAFSTVQQSGDHWKQELDIIRDHFANEDAGDADKAPA